MEKYMWRAAFSSTGIKAKNLSKLIQENPTLFYLIPSNHSIEKYAYIVDTRYSKSRLEFVWDEPSYISSIQEFEHYIVGKYRYEYELK